MSAAFLIDGYNLLHAMGILGGPVGPHGLEKARARLLGLLHGGFGGQSAAVTVVFDAAAATPKAQAEQEYRGVRVVFAQGNQEADDVIERLIRQSSAPKALHVVSDDRRVQQAATRRGCQAHGCESFLQWMDRHRRAQRQADPGPEKKDCITEEEARQWLAEFADLERDPALRDAFQSFDFEKE
jgi:predicted RNA-binding protein with PIN domain